MEELAIRVRLEGVDDANRQVSQLTGQLSQLAFAFSLFASTVASVSALRFADDIEAIRLQFEALTGSASEAEAILQRIVELAQQSVFDTRDVAQFAALLRSAGVAGKELERELTALLNLSAALGVSRSDFQRFSENLLQIRSGAGTLADVRQLLRAAPGVAAFLAQQLGRENLSVRDISELLQREGGERFYRRLIEAGEARAGAATRTTPLTALANFVELIQFQLLPTGELFGRILRVALNVLTPIVKALGAFNRVLGGVPALIVAFTVAVSAATASLRALSATGFGRAIADTWTILIGILGLIVMRLKLVLGNLKGLSFAGLIGGLLGLLGNAIGGVIGELLSYIGTGLGIGALAGSVIPALGTAMGALIGAIVGAIGFLIKRVFFPDAAESAQARTARNTERMARTLEEISIKLVGGDRGAAALKSRLEAQLALARLLEGGVV